MGRWEVLFKGGEHRVSLTSYLFVSDVNQGNERAVCLMLIKETKGMGQRFSCMPTGMERHSLDLLQAVKNIMGCESVWNS